MIAQRWQPPTIEGVYIDNAHYSRRLNETRPRAVFTRLFNPVMVIRYRLAGGPKHIEFSFYSTPIPRIEVLALPWQGQLILNLPLANYPT